MGVFRTEKERGGEKGLEVRIGSKDWEEPGWVGQLEVQKAELSRRKEQG